ncbi:MAG: TetR/AcrR family transcriptional regulator [Desulfovibrio sp.]|nr:MAG: TetR/AcrR family transcriptional regulator [Desulfovibrio sp.]
MINPAPSPREQRKQEKRQRILAAAAQVFSDNGFSRTTMSHVAERADVGKGTLYEYFPSKDDLYYSVFQSLVREVFAGLSLDRERETAAEELMELNVMMVANMEGFRDHYGLFMEFWSASASSHSRERFQEGFRELYTLFGDHVAGILRKGVSQGEFRDDLDCGALAASLVCAWDAMGLQAWFDPAFSPGRVANEFMRVIFRGINREE